MEPHFEKIDKLMYYDYLKNANSYFEFGSGGSTFKAMQNKNVKKVYSVESDVNWFNKVNSDCNKINKNNKFNFTLVDLKCVPNNWGKPGVNSEKSDWVKYSSSLCNLNKEDISNINLILIDGRFRVACCLKCFDVINDDCLIIFDDFLNRPQYFIVLQFFDIINKTKDKRMVILKKKKVVSPTIELIQKYEMLID
jgi:hypothetical protein